VYVAWLENELKIISRSPAGTWQPISDIPQPGAPLLPEVELSVDQQLNLYVVVNKNGILYYMIRDANGAWSNPVPITDPEQYVDRFKMTVGADRKMHCVWSGNGFDRYHVRFPNGVLSKNFDLPSELGLPSLLAGPDGSAGFLWISSGDWSLRYERVNISPNGDASVSKMVTILPTMHAPTLSFQYVLENAALGHSFSAGVNETPVLTLTNNNNGWTHGLDKRSH
jgi:hypothetical protein